MKIKEVKAHVAPMGGSWITERVIANPMSIYPEYFERRSSWYRKNTAAVIEVVAEDGTCGLGFVGGSKGRAAAAILEDQIRDLVVGKSVFQTELLQEQLYRASIHYGRGGLAHDLLSAIDIACWDAKGKILGRPVYDLLGGKCQERLRPYYTGWDPEALREFGMKDMKIATPWGPAHGEEGMRKNEEAVAKAREVLGPDGMIALDIYMGWDVPYTIRMYERIAKYNIAWLEEPVLPDDYDGYRRIRDGVGTMVTGGEHEYTLAGFRRLIEGGCVDIVQPDLYRAGGPTGLKKIAALARAHHVKLICHGIGSATYHYLLSNGPELSPRCEYIDWARGTDATWVLADHPKPVDGWLSIPEKPGFGYRLEPKAFRKGAQVIPMW